MTNEFWDKIFSAATDLGVEPPTMRQWKSRQKIPGDRHIPLIKASEGKAYQISMDEISRMGAQQ